MRTVALALAGSVVDIGGWWRAFAGALIGYLGLVFFVSLEAEDD